MHSIRFRLKIHVGCCNGVPVPIRRPTSRRACPDIHDAATVLPQFLEVYGKLCSGAAGAEHVSCLQSLVIPPAEQQQSLLDILDSLSEVMPIDDIRPVLLHYMVRDDVQSFNMLLEQYAHYLKHMTTVRQIVQGTLMAVKEAAANTPPSI